MDLERSSRFKRYFRGEIDWTRWWIGLGGKEERDEVIPDILGHSLDFGVCQWSSLHSCWCPPALLMPPGPVWILLLPWTTSLLWYEGNPNTCATSHFTPRFPGLLRITLLKEITEPLWRKALRRQDDNPYFIGSLEDLNNNFYKAPNTVHEKCTQRCATR